MRIDRLSVKLLVAGAVGLVVTFALVGQYRRALEARAEAAATAAAVNADCWRSAARWAEGGDVRYTADARNLWRHVLGDLVPMEAPWGMAEAVLISSNAVSAAATISPRAFTPEATWADLQPYITVCQMCAGVQARVQCEGGGKRIEAAARAVLSDGLKKLAVCAYPDVRSVAEQTLKVLDWHGGW